MATLARGAHTVNTIFIKPIGRNAYHKTSSYADMMRETMKLEVEELKRKRHSGCDSPDGIIWVPHERTGIYYPIGHEKVMEDVPPQAARDLASVNWFS